MPPMTFSEFRNSVTRGLDNYLRLLAGLVAKSQLRAAPGHVFLFPSMLLFTETDTHYVFELLGSRPERGQLLVKENSRVASFNRVVGGFDSDDSTFYIFGTGTSEPTNIHLPIANMTLTSALHMEQLEDRFPGFAGLSPTSQIRAFTSSQSFMPIDAQCVRTLTLNKCYLTSNVGAIIRPRYINFLFGESKEADMPEFTADLGRSLNIPSIELAGVTIVPEGKRQSLVLAAEFSSLYLQDVEETTLTQFLAGHEDMVKRAFGADRVFFEQSLPWIDGNPDETELFIRPDVIVRRSNGSWLIVDFKLPLLDKDKLTAGRRARRRFIYTVNDGISQLANYADYFGSAANQAAAAEILGEVVSNPSVALVVGSSENVNITEVNEAKRSLKDIDVVDYDTLIRLSLAGLK
jgi:hypothetical protein